MKLKINVIGKIYCNNEIVETFPGITLQKLVLQNFV